MQIQKVGDWKRFLAYTQKLPHVTQAAVKIAMRNEAEFLRKQMVDGIKAQAPGGKKFKPLSEYTKVVRRFKNFVHDKALIKSATLLNAIHVFEEGNNFFIGVRRTRKDGKEVVDIAKIHEEGSGPITIQITPKMRKFLMLAFKEAGIYERGRGGGEGDGIMVIRIPPRPFIAPVVTKYSRSRGQRVLADMETIMRAAK